MSLPETTLSTGFATGGARIRNGLARAKDATIRAANLPRLTSQQMAFVDALVNGAETYTAAYLIAYPTAQKWPRHAVWSSASQMASKPKVKQWLDIAWSAQTKAVDRSINGHLTRLEKAQERVWKQADRLENGATKKVLDDGTSVVEIGDDLPYIKAALDAEKQHAQALGIGQQEAAKADVTINLVSFQEVSVSEDGRTVTAKPRVVNAKPLK